MTSIGLDHFRRILQRLAQRTRERTVEWSVNDVEETFVVEFDTGTEINVYSRHNPAETDVVGALLRVKHKIVVTLTAERGDEDWDLLSLLVDEVAAQTETNDEEIEWIEESLESDEPVGQDPETVSTATFNPMRRSGFMSFEDLTDDDSGFAAEDRD